MITDLARGRYLCAVRRLGAPLDSDKSVREFSTHRDRRTIFRLHDVEFHILRCSIKRNIIRGLLLFLDFLFSYGKDCRQASNIHAAKHSSLDAETSAYQPSRYAKESENYEKAKRRAIK